jgi:type IV pilus assembly protein PilF
MSGWYAISGLASCTSRSLASGALLWLAAACGLVACTSATPQLDTLTQAEPDSTRQRAMRRLSLASAYYEQNQNDVAQQEVRAALQIDANYADAYSLLGLIHQRAKAPALAQQSFEQALQLASQPPVRSDELGAIQHNYGWFLCEQNRFAEAQTQLGRALSQLGYASADKTNKAIEFCKKRATPADTRQHNH